MTTTWNGAITALSSIAHGGETHGTITLLRRELIAQPDGHLVHVPIISGNTLRGRLRRVGEELLRDTLKYEGEISPAAAHALRGGGALAKSSHEPLSGNRLQNLRNLVPQIGVFGAAGGGVIIDGAVDVGKVVPHVSETTHITGVPSSVSMFNATQIETYARQDDSTSHDFANVLAASEPMTMFLDSDGAPNISSNAPTTQQMVFNVETFPAGTTFSSWIRLRRPTALELAFFVDVLEEYGLDARLGGRIGVGHGRIHLGLHAVPALAAERLDWRTEVIEHRAEILEALETLA